MEIKIDVEIDEKTKKLKYLVNDTSDQAITVIMFALATLARERVTYEQFIETITRMWGHLNEIEEEENS